MLSERVFGSLLQKVGAASTQHVSSVNKTVQLSSVLFVWCGRGFSRRCVSSASGAMAQITYSRAGEALLYQTY